MKKVTKALASTGLAIGLALGANLGTAQAAEAATGHYFTHYEGWGRCGLYYFTDYNWWEELQGKKDFTVRLYTVRC